MSPLREAVKKALASARPRPFPTEIEVSPRGHESAPGSRVGGKRRRRAEWLPRPPRMGVRTHHEEGTPPAEPFRSSPRFGSDQNRESRATPKARPVTRSLRRGRPAETSVTLQNFVANYMLALTCSGSLNISFAPGFYVGGDLHWELGAEKWTILTWARQGRHVAAC
jgi:hypothetical protein